MIKINSKTSVIHGTGLFSTVLLVEGDLIAEFKYKQKHSHANDYTFKINEEFQEVKPPLKYLNHSCKPNSKVLEINSCLFLIAIKNINPHEEITLNYGKGIGFTVPNPCFCNICQSKIFK